MDVASNPCHNPVWFTNTKVATPPPFYFTLLDARFYYVGEDMKGGEDSQLEAEELHSSLRTGKYQNILC